MDPIALYLALPVPFQGLSAEEAVIQLGFAQKPKAVFVRNAIQNAMNNAVAHRNMNPKRLIVTYCYATKGRYLKRIRYHAKGRRGIMFRYFSHLRLLCVAFYAFPKFSKLCFPPPTSELA